MLEPKIVPKRKSAILGQAFDGDLLERKKLGMALARYVERLRVGAVLAIDAPWGEGKTWFGQNLALHLKGNNCQVVYMDAFANDYLDDAFQFVAGELLEQLESRMGQKSNLREKAINLIRIMGPASMRVGINFLGKVLLGSTDLVDDVKTVVSDIQKETADQVSKYIEGQLKSQIEMKEMVRDFKMVLSEMAGDPEDANTRPLVVFIDELDRCKPTFAVQLIERLKHFFDVPNVIFVLLLNRHQLEKAIKGVYGSDTDAERYLSKFIDLSLTLPKLGGKNPSVRQIMIRDILQRFDANHASGDPEKYGPAFLQLTQVYELSARDLERVMTLYMLVGNAGADEVFMPFFAVLQIVCREKIQAIADGDLDVCSKEMGFLEEKAKSISIQGRELNYIKIYQGLLQCVVHGVSPTAVRGFDGTIYATYSEKEMREKILKQIGLLGFGGIL